MKEEIVKYLSKSEKLLADADVMLKNEILDGAINRAYYSMFTALRATLYVHDIFTKSHTGAHTKFRELYIKNNRLPKELSQSLTMVFELRQTADYDMESLDDREVAAEALQKAKAFVHEISILLAAQDD